jgi:hypothetical protein
VFYVELEKLTDKSTLLELAQDLSKRYPKANVAFNLYYRSFHMTQLFLSEIWDRILKDLQLEQKYWNVQGEIEAKMQYYELGEEYELSEEEAKIVNEYSKHEYRLNLDVEDWFLHTHILMEKYVKLYKLLMIMTAKDREYAKFAHELPNRSFHEHQKSFIKSDTRIRDEKYIEIINNCKSWYDSDVKNVRDDLIEHEQIGRFWGRETSATQFTISRFRRTDRMTEKLYRLRDKYEKAYSVLQGQMNIYKLLNFFETNLTKLEQADAQMIIGIRKEYGRRFPDIPTLYAKMNHFFSLVNDYFMSEEK